MSRALGEIAGDREPEAGAGQAGARGASVPVEQDRHEMAGTPRRRRSTAVPIDGTQAGRILDEILAGNDTAAHQALEDAFGGSVTLSDISSLSTFK